MIKRTIIAGETWFPRLFIDSSLVPQLLLYPQVGTGTPLDVSGYSAHLAIDQDGASYPFPSISSTGTAAGYFDFVVPAETTAGLILGTATAEIEWTKTPTLAVPAPEDRHKFQFKLVTSRRVIDLITEVEMKIANFGGMTGTTITHTGDGTEVYQVHITPTGTPDGKIGEFSATVLTATTFIVKNTGTGRGQFKWRVFK